MIILPAVTSTTLGVIVGKAGTVSDETISAGIKAWPYMMEISEVCGESDT